MLMKLYKLVVLLFQYSYIQRDLGEERALLLYSLSTRNIIANARLA
jgi:hypothetical protein